MGCRSGGVPGSSVSNARSASSSRVSYIALADASSPALIAKEATLTLLPSGARLGFLWRPMLRRLPCVAAYVDFLNVIFRPQFPSQSRVQSKVDPRKCRLLIHPSRTPMSPISQASAPPHAPVVAHSCYPKPLIALVLTFLLFLHLRMFVGHIGTRRTK